MRERDVEREGVWLDLNFVSSASNSVELRGCSLEGKLIDLQWICDDAIFTHRERKREI